MISSAFHIRFALAAAAVLGGMYLCPSSVRAESTADWIVRGNRFYAEERYSEAIEAYRHALQLAPTSPVVQYNLGTALARSGQNEDGVQALAQSTQSAAEAVRKRDAWFNLGVAQAEPAEPEGIGAVLGQMNPMDGDPQKQIERLSEAVNAFRQAILADPEDIEAKYNYELTHERLEQLKQQQEQQQSSDDNKDQQDEKGDQDQESKDGQKNGEPSKDDQKSDDQKSDEEKSQDDKQENSSEESPKQQDEKQNEQKKSDEASQDKGLEDESKPQESEPQDQSQPDSPPQDPSQATGGQSGAAGEEPELTPEQMDALRILNLLEKEKPEQFKQLFRFKGGPSHQLEKDW